jgi:integrase
LGARVEDYEDGVLTIRNTKEGQDFNLQLCEEVRGLVEQLKESVSYERGLLVCSRRYGRVEPETQLCPKGVNSMLKKHAERLGIKEFSSHSGRVTAITNLLRKGYTYEEVRTVSRHSSNAVVEEYDRRTFQKPEINYGGNEK